MADPFEIILAAGPQKFEVTIGGVAYLFALRWSNAPLGGWFLDIDSAAGVRLVSGIPLVTGADILAPYRHLGFTGALIVASEGDVDALPTFAGLGEASRVYVVPDA